MKKNKIFDLIGIATMAVAGLFVASSKTSGAMKTDATVASNVTNGNQRINVVIPSDISWIFNDDAKIFSSGVSDSIKDFDFVADTDIGSNTSKQSAGVRKMTIGSNEYYVATKSLGVDFTTTWWNFAVERHCGENYHNKQTIHNGKVWTEAANTFKYDGESLTNWGNYYKIALHTGINLENVSYVLKYAVDYEPSDPEAISGYDFAGWYTDEELTVSYEKGNLTGDINLYAKYEVAKAKHSVTYIANGGEGTLPTQEDVAEESTFKVGGALTKEGNHFGGWSDGIDLYQPNDDYTMGTSNVTLTAQWTPYAHENGYYVAGSMTSWDTNPLKMEYQEAIPDVRSEQYHYSLTADVDDEFCIIKFTADEKTYFKWNLVQSGKDSAIDAGQIEDSGGEYHNIKVKVAGTYSIYYKPVENKIWISEAPIVHTYKLAVTHESTTTEYDLSVNPGNENELVSSSITFYSGDTISYLVDGVSQEATRKVIQNNNLWNNSGVATVCVNCTDVVYVDKVSNTLFLHGLEINKFYIIKNNVPYVLTSNGEKEGFDEYFVTNFLLAHGDKIKFLNTRTDNGDSNAKVFSILKINSFSLDVFSNESGEYLEYKLEESQSLKVYLKMKYELDEVYVGEQTEAETQAFTFAASFNSSIGGTCKEDGSTSKSDLSTAWATMATAYGELSDDAKEIVSGASKESQNADLKAFGEKYDYVFAKYGVELSLENFASRPKSSAGSVTTISPVSNNETSTWIIVAVALSSLTALGLCIVCKKRKSINN